MARGRCWRGSSAAERRCESIRGIAGIGAEPTGRPPPGDRSAAAPPIDQNANREMFEESVEVMFKAFEGKPLSHQGKYYTIPPEVPYRGYTLKEITLVPALERLPVECWR
jgi:hypothetical protein